MYRNLSSAHQMSTFVINVDACTEQGNDDESNEGKVNPPEI